MIGKNVLWVAKQHGHSTTTMLRTYAAWTDGAAETDVEAIKRSMMLTPPRESRPRPIDRCRSARRSPSQPGRLVAAVFFARRRRSCESERA